MLPGGFLAGMAAFALGHFAYVWAFFRWERRLALELSIPVVIYIAWMLAQVLGGAGEMAAPVAIYAMVIGLMIWRAAAVAPATSGSMADAWRWAPLCGALLFAFSDSLISIRMFAIPTLDAHYVIMVTYWVGQLLIASAGVLRRA